MSKFRVGMANDESTVTQLEECCIDDDSARLAEVVDTSFEEIHRKPYKNDKNEHGWPSVGVSVSLNIFC